MALQFREGFINLVVVSNDELPLVLQIPALPFFFRQIQVRAFDDLQVGIVGPSFLIFITSFQF